MIITLTSTIVFALVLSILFLNKNRELKTGSSMFTVGTSDTDIKITSLYRAFISYIHVLHPKKIKDVSSRKVVKVERFFMNIFDRLSRRFNVVGEIVTGRDIPKNRGSVSFFLKNIEDSKKQAK